jgi:hypothetical protein
MHARRTLRRLALPHSFMVVQLLNGFQTLLLVHLRVPPKVRGLQLSPKALGVYITKRADAFRAKTSRTFRRQARWLQAL